MPRYGGRSDQPVDLAIVENDLVIVDETTTSTDRACLRADVLM